MTIEINYLPWRESIRKEKKKKLITQLTLLALITAGGWYAFYSVEADQLNYQQKRNKFIETNSALFDTQIVEIQAMKEDKIKILSRAEIINQLESTRYTVIKVMDLVTKQLPDTIYIKNFTINEDEIIALGVSRSKPDISRLVRTVSKSEFFINSKVEYVNVVDESKAEGQREYEFLIRAMLPQAEEEVIDEK